MPDYDILAQRIYSHSLASEAREWIEEGKVPGPFLRSVIRNDLRGAVERSLDAEHITTVVKWFYHEAPQGSWGSDKCLSNWPLYLRAKRNQEEFAK